LSRSGEPCGVRIKAAVDVAVAQVKAARRYVIWAVAPDGSFSFAISGQAELPQSAMSAGQ
jgi:hypothetical protein